MAEFDAFFNSYVETALWVGGEDAAGCDWTDIAPESLAEMREDCESFYEECLDMIKHDLSRAGHDFYLTRNRHGAGFWDGDWPENGKVLTERSHPYGTQELYLGDDGVLYHHN